jgi:hypothetical protein
MTGPQAELLLLLLRVQVAAVTRVMQQNSSSNHSFERSVCNSNLQTFR